MMSEEKRFNFENLKAYQEARKLVTVVYGLLKTFPAEEKYALCDQLRRAAISIVSNIAEGSSRSSDKEQKHFIEMSYGSLMEVYCQFQIARDLEYVTDEQLKDVFSLIYPISKQLSGLRHHFDK
jgi:four helix bundle protein